MSQWESHHPTKKGISIPTDINIYIYLIWWCETNPQELGHQSKKPWRIKDLKRALNILEDCSSRKLSTSMNRDPRSQPSSVCFSQKAGRSHKNLLVHHHILWIVEWLLEGSIFETIPTQMVCLNIFDWDILVKSNTLPWKNATQPIGKLPQRLIIHGNFKILKGIGCIFGNIDVAYIVEVHFFIYIRMHIGWYP